MTSPMLTSFDGLNAAPDPILYPPPWIHTMTGNRLRDRAGVVTLR